MPFGINFKFDFAWIFGGKIEASCHQDRSKIDVHFGKRCFEKTLFFLKKNRTFEGAGGQGWDLKSIKNISKIELNIGRSFDIDF